MLERNIKRPGYYTPPDVKEPSINLPKITENGSDPRKRWLYDMGIKAWRADYFPREYNFRDGKYTPEYIRYSFKNNEDLLTFTLRWS